MQPITHPDFVTEDLSLTRDGLSRLLPEDSRIFTVSGHAMAPAIVHDDILVVGPAPETPNDGDIVIAKLPKDVLVCRIWLDGCPSSEREEERVPALGPDIASEEFPFLTKYEIVGIVTGRIGILQPARESL